MACHGCGSDWVTGGNIARPWLNGKDCVSCPWCCKVVRCKERKRGRWNRPAGEPFRKNVHRKKTPRAKRKSDSCHHCGKPLGPKQIKYCHSSCFHAARSSGTQQWDRTNQTEGCYHRGGRWNSSISKRYVKRIAGLDRWLSAVSSLSKRMWRIHQTQRQCEVCGDDCNEGASRFCSYKCVIEWRGIRNCDVCGAEVSDSNAYGRCRCEACKDRLRREAKRRHKNKYGRNHRQRARRAGVSYVSIPVRAIYERDGWQCQICNRKCKKTFVVSKNDGRPHPRSPTLDHIRSFKDGGNHEPSNVQLACFECNSKKGAVSFGQLRIGFV